MIIRRHDGVCKGNEHMAMRHPTDRFALIGGEDGEIDIRAI
jgi:hypothetical protein